MTTKPKAQRFRIRRSEDRRPATDKPADDGDAFAPEDDGFGDTTFPTARAPETKPPEEIAAEIKKIEGEGLTTRQLRMARRLAQKHNIVASSDVDAVRLLRAQGIDPFQRVNMLELVEAEKSGAKAKAKPKSKKEKAGAQKNLPQTTGQPGQAGTEVGHQPTAADVRAREVMEIQRDIARRRRRNILALMARLTVFVTIPTIIAGYYFYAVATPMYATKSEFVIQQADGGASPMGGLFSGTGFATSQDSITVQSYLGSRDAMLRLDENLGFREHFSQGSIDRLQRLAPDASNEDAYKIFKRNVKIGYDPTEGIIKMEVVAADPEVSAAFSQALIGFAEEQVDDLTQRLREDQMRGARDSFREAEEKMVAAQNRVLELQVQLGVLDPASETASIMTQVGTFETELAEKRLRLRQLQSNPSPNAARVAGVQGDIERLEELVIELRAQLTESVQGENSLAQVNSRLSMAQVDLETRTMMMQEALASQESARIEANRQVRYLSLGVNPVPPDEPTYPRAFENTAVAFFIFAGIYLMLSLTVSVLREQVSS